MAAITKLVYTPWVHLDSSIILSKPQLINLVKSRSESIVPLDHKCVSLLLADRPSILTQLSLGPTSSHQASRALTLASMFGDVASMLVMLK